MAPVPSRAMVAGGGAARPTVSRALGLRVIIAYKLARTLLQGAVAIGVLVGVHHGLAHEVLHLGTLLQDHAVHASVKALARLLLASATHLQILALGLGLDASLSALEAWSLHHNYRWGSWLVVVTTGSLLPWEVAELFRRFRVGRLVLLFINLAVVAYLVGRALAHRHHGHDPT